MSQDIPLGKGDNAPAPTWDVPFDPSGSTFELHIEAPSAGINWMIRSDDAVGALTVERVGDTAGRVVWPVTSDLSARLPLGRIATYTLRRLVTGGEVRYYVAGFFVMTKGPAQPTAVQALALGPQGLSAYQVAVANGFVGDEAAWLLSLVGSNPDALAQLIAAAVAAQQATFAGGLDLSVPGNFFSF